MTTTTTPKTTGRVVPDSVYAELIAKKRRECREQGLIR